MDDVTQTRTASVLGALLGVWMLLSPFFITTTGGALASTLIVGGLLVLAGGAQLVWESTVPSWVSGLTAVWMGISAAAFGMTDALFWNTAIVAVATLLLAMWDGVEVDKVAHQHHTSTS